MTQFINNPLSLLQFITLHAALIRFPLMHGGKVIRLNMDHPKLTCQGSVIYSHGQCTNSYMYMYTDIDNPGKNC